MYYATRQHSKQRLSEDEILDEVKKPTDAKRPAHSKDTVLSPLADLSQVLQTNNLKEDLLDGRPLRIALAVTRSRTSEKRPGRDLLVATAAVLRSLTGIPDDERNWDTALSNMTQIPLLGPDPDPEHRSAALPSRGGIFSFGKRIGAEKVKLWLSTLVANEDISDTLAIDSSALSDSLSLLGTRIPSHWLKGVRREQPFIDINVLWLPDGDRPYFMLYRIKVDAWFQRWPFFSFRRPVNGLAGVFQAYKFSPQKSMIDGLSPQLVEQAVSEANTFFDNYPGPPGSESSR